MKLVLMADTHNRGRCRVPDGDVLVFAGDMCLPGGLEEVEVFANWLAPMSHPYKVVIAGNHDFPFERPNEAADARKILAEQNITYLEDSGLVINGVNFWGSPWQPWFYNWAFNLQRGPEIRAKWDLIPDETDVLITHGPPMFFQDWNGREHVGCADLFDTVTKRVKPLLHVFGHIHEGYGAYRQGEMMFVNASVCDSRYAQSNPVLTHELFTALKAGNDV